MDTLLKFHGTDWVGMFFGLVSAYYIAKHRRWGFVFGVVAGLGWIAFAIVIGSVASLVANILFIVINCRGFLRWKQKGQGASPP